MWEGTLAGPAGHPGGAGPGCPGWDGGDPSLGAAGSGCPAQGGTQVPRYIPRPGPVGPPAGAGVGYPGQGYPDWGGGTQPYRAAEGGGCPERGWAPVPRYTPPPAPVGLPASAGAGYPGCNAQPNGYPEQQWAQFTSAPCQMWPGAVATWGQRPPAGTAPPEIVGAPRLFKAVTKGDLRLHELRSEVRKQRQQGKWWFPRYDQCGPCGVWCCSAPVCVFWLAILIACTCGLIVLATTYGMSGGFEVDVSNIRVREIPKVDSKECRGRLDLDINFTFTNTARNSFVLPHLSRVSGDVGYRTYGFGVFTVDGGPVPSGSTSNYILHVLSRDMRRMPKTSRITLATLLLQDYITMNPLPIVIDLSVHEGYVTFTNWNLTVPFTAGVSCTMGILIEDHKALTNCNGNCSNLGQNWMEAMQEGMKTREARGQQLCSRVHIQGSLALIIWVVFLIYLVSLCCVICVPVYRYTHRPPAVAEDEERVSLPNTSEKE